MKTRKRKILSICQLKTIHGRRVFSGILDFADGKTDWEVFLSEPWERFDMRQFKKAKTDGVDGVIITLPGTAEAMSALLRSDVPTVFVNIPDLRLPAKRKQVSYVYTDNEDIGRKGGEYVLSLGPLKSFGFVGTSTREFWSVERERAYRAVVRPQGEYFAFDNGGSLMKWIDGLPKPTAIMTATDVDAAAVRTECRRLRLAVPQEVSILGVDCRPLPARKNDIPISSVTTDMQALGFRAAEELDRLLRGGSRCGSREIVIPAKGVTVRKSTSRACPTAHLPTDILSFIQANFTRTISVADITAGLGCSRRLAEMRFRQIDGRSIREALEDVRLENAKDLLVTGELTVAEIARRCGLGSPERLSRLFRRKTDNTIRDYRIGTSE